MLVGLTLTTESLVTSITSFLWMIPHLLQRTAKEQSSQGGVHQPSYASLSGAAGAGEEQNAASKKSIICTYLAQAITIA